MNSFYTYSGSLTTPGCTQGVLWSVLADGGSVSKAAVTRFHKVIVRFPITPATRTTTARSYPSAAGSSSSAAAERTTGPKNSRCYVHRNSLIRLLSSPASNLHFSVRVAQVVGEGLVMLA